MAIEQSSKIAAFAVVGFDPATRQPYFKVNRGFLSNIVHFIPSMAPPGDQGGYQLFPDDTAAVDPDTCAFEISAPTDFTTGTYFVGIGGWYLDPMTGLWTVIAASLDINSDNHANEFAVVIERTTG